MNVFKLKTINPLDDPDWDQRVLSSGSSCPFHSRAWARTLYESYGFTPIYFARSCGHHFDVLIPLMHVQSWATGRRGVSLPFSDFCTWIAPSDEIEKIFFQVKEAGASYRWRYLETRNEHHYPKTAPAFQSLWRHDLDLRPVQADLWQGLSSEVRTAIRKSQNAGVELRFSQSIEDFREFYRLHTLTRKKQGIPPQPWNFFEHIFKHIITTGLGEIGIAHRKGVNLASAIYFYFGNSALYKYGASDPHLLDLRGNNALMWAAIIRCAQNGYKTLSMGRTDTANEGLRRFKLGWGCRESPLDYFRYDYQLKAFATVQSKPIKWARDIARKTPLPVLKLAGAWLYPHLS